MKRFFFRKKSKPATFLRKRVEYNGTEFTIVELTVSEIEGFRAYTMSEGCRDSLAMCFLIAEGVEEFLHEPPEKILNEIGPGCMQFLMDEVLKLSALHPDAVEETEKNS